MLVCGKLLRLSQTSSVYIAGVIGKRHDWPGLRSASIDTAESQNRPFGELAVPTQGPSRETAVAAPALIAIKGDVALRLRLRMIHSTTPHRETRPCK